MFLDPVIWVSMIFTLIAMMLVGGFILLFPITRRLGVLIEEWIRDKREPGRIEPEELARLKDAIDGIETQIAHLDERQRFVEGLVDARSLPATDADASGGAEPGAGDEDWRP